MSRISLIVMMLVVLLFGFFLGTRVNDPKPENEKEKKLLDAYDLIRDAYVDEINPDSLVSAGIRGMAGYLDPHTSYIEPEKASYIQAEFNGNFDGIGIEFNLVRDTLTVVTPISGGPSSIAGIISGDRIVAIDSVSAVGLAQEEILRKLRGKQGTEVQLKIYRPVDRSLHDFVIRRGNIATSSIDGAFKLDAETGYIRISRFIATSSDEFHAALLKLKNDGMRRLIVDLRGNPGGYLEQAVTIADEFLGKGKLIVYTRSRLGDEENLRYEAKNGGLFEEGALVLLIDRESASASEILAGALQDNQRATLVGEASFGKGLVQRQVSFPDGSVFRMTVSRYYTPSGRQIQRTYHNGVVGRNDYFNETGATWETRARRFYTSFPLYMQVGERFVYRIPEEARVSKGNMEGKDTLRVSGKGSGQTPYIDGGIIPDFWLTEKKYSPLLSQLYEVHIFDTIARRILDTPGSSVQDYRGSLSRFIDLYTEERNFDRLFISAGVTDKINLRPVSYRAERQNIVTSVKSALAYQLFGSEGLVRYKILKQDEAVKVATRVPVP